MRRSLFRRMLRLPIAIAVALGLLVQTLLPAAAFAGPIDPLLALGPICHAGGAGHSDHGPSQAPGHAHEHCLLCQAGAVAFLPPDAPPFQFLRQVASAPMAKVPSLSMAAAFRPAYASRAPPGLG